MRLKIINEQLSSVLAIGIDKNGTKHKVVRGGLFDGEVINVERYKQHTDLFIHPKINYESIDIFSDHFDKDGLISFNKLAEVISKSKPYHRVFEIGGYWVFPEVRIKNHIEYLYSNNLTRFAKIKITSNWFTSLNRAPVYAVNYLDMIQKIVTNRKPVSSWFICERERDYDNMIYADLFIIGNLSQNDLQVQLWQIIGEGSELLYAHGLIDSKTYKFNHFDLASHYVNPTRLPEFIYNKHRMDLIGKKKWLRIDGPISDDDVFELIKMFFPMDYLVEEFKEHPVAI